MDQRSLRRLPRNFRCHGGGRTFSSAVRLLGSRKESLASVSSGARGPWRLARSCVRRRPGRLRRPQAVLGLRCPGTSARAPRSASTISSWPHRQGRRRRARALSSPPACRADRADRRRRSAARLYDQPRGRRDATQVRARRPSRRALPGRVAAERPARRSPSAPRRAAGREPDDARPRGGDAAHMRPRPAPRHPRRGPGTSAETRARRQAGSWPWPGWAGLGTFDVQALRRVANELAFEIGPLLDGRDGVHGLDRIGRCSLSIREAVDGIEHVKLSRPAYTRVHVLLQAQCIFPDGSVRGDLYSTGELGGYWLFVIQRLGRLLWSETTQSIRPRGPASDLAPPGKQLIALCSAS